jgi:hypothetical protein
MSRLAISHIEMDLTIPSKRSSTSFNFVFKLSPIQLFEGTTYLRAKMERLPEIITTNTDLELNFALLKNDQEWIDRLSHHWKKNEWIQQLKEKWYPMLDDWDNAYLVSMKQRY